MPREPQKQYTEAEITELLEMGTFNTEIKHTPRTINSLTRQYPTLAEKMRTCCLMEIDAYLQDNAQNLLSLLTLFDQDPETIQLLLEKLITNFDDYQPTIMTLRNIYNRTKEPFTQRLLDTIIANLSLYITDIDKLITFASFFQNLRPVLYEEYYLKQLYDDPKLNAKTIIRLATLFKDHQESIYRQHQPNLATLIDDNLETLLQLAKAFPEHQEDIYSLFESEPMSYTKGDLSALLRLRRTFPHHEGSLFEHYQTHQTAYVHLKEREATPLEKISALVQAFPAQTEPFFYDVMDNLADYTTSPQSLFSLLQIFSNYRKQLTDALALDPLKYSKNSIPILKALINIAHIPPELILQKIQANLSEVTDYELKKLIRIIALFPENKDLFFDECRKHFADYLHHSFYNIDLLIKTFLEEKEVIFGLLQQRKDYYTNHDPYAFKTIATHFFEPWYQDHLFRHLQTSFDRYLHHPAYERLEEGTYAIRLFAETFTNQRTILLRIHLRTLADEHKKNPNHLRRLTRIFNEPEEREIIYEACRTDKSLYGGNTRQNLRKLKKIFPEHADHIDTLMAAASLQKRGQFRKPSDASITKCADMTCAHS